MSEHLAPIDPKTPGFDPQEPNSGGLLVFILITVVIIAAVVIGVSGFYSVVAEHQEEEVINARPSEELAALHAREDQQLTTYGYINKEKGLVQIPIDRAMELVAREAAEGKVKWPTTPSPIKQETPAPAPVQTAQK